VSSFAQNFFFSQVLTQSFLQTMYFRPSPAVLLDRSILPGVSKNLPATVMRGAGWADVLKGALGAVGSVVRRVAENPAIQKAASRALKVGTKFVSQLAANKMQQALQNSSPEMQQIAGPAFAAANQGLVDAGSFLQEQARQTAAALASQDQVAALRQQLADLRSRLPAAASDVAARILDTAANTGAAAANVGLDAADPAGGLLYVGSVRRKGGLMQVGSTGGLLTAGYAPRAGAGMAVAKAKKLAGGMLKF
jgi:hypothetical protein